MATRIKIPYKTAWSVLLIAPTDVRDPNAHVVLNDAAGASSSYKIFDACRAGLISADEASGQTELSVTDSADFEDGANVEVDLDSGAVHESTVSSTDPAAGTITIADPLPSAASSGRRVRTRLGAAIAQTEYGTASLGTRTWGYRGITPSNHAGLFIGTKIDVEISFVGAAGNVLDLLKVICAEIRPIQDCEC